MPEISACVAPANRARARLVKRAIILRPLGVFDVQLASGRKRLARASIARRQNAVKHVDAPRDRFHEIFRRADAHQVSWKVSRQSRRDLVYYFKHYRLLFTDAQSADGVAVETDLDRLLETLSPQIHVTGALNNAKQCLCAAECFRFDASGISAGGLLFIEEPLLSENPEALAQIAALTSTPIALGERLYSRWDFKPFFENGAVDIIQPDLSHAGGLLECRKIAAMAEAYDVAVAPHCPLGPLALSSCLQLAACTPNVAIQEMSLGIHYNVGHDLLEFCADKAVLTPTDGYLAIPTGPGLGITIDEQAVREVHKDRHRWRNPIWRYQDGSFAEW